MHPRRLRLACLLLVWACAWGPPAYAQDLWPDLSKPPAAQGGGERDSALIVGIEDYDKVADVPGAEHNAKAWYLYLTQTRKLPVESVRLLKNDEATLDALQREAQTARQRVKPGGTLWVIFIGHGAPSKDGKDGLLVGADARQNPDSIYERSLRVGWRPALGDERQSLLDLLQGGPQEHTTLILDTCFSGQTQADQPLVAGLQPLIPVHTQTAPAPALTVLTATSRQEFAGPLPGGSLPAFSYLLLGALRGWGDEDRDGQVTYAEALAYTRRTLSAVLKGRSQTPELRSADPDRVVSKPRGGEQAPDLTRIILATPHLSTSPQVQPNPSNSTEWNTPSRQITNNQNNIETPTATLHKEKNISPGQTISLSENIIFANNEEDSPLAECTIDEIWPIVTLEKFKYLLLNISCYQEGWSDEFSSVISYDTTQEKFENILPAKKRGVGVSKIIDLNHDGVTEIVSYTQEDEGMFSSCFPEYYHIFNLSKNNLKTIFQSNYDNLEEIENCLRESDETMDIQFKVDIQFKDINQDNSLDIVETIFIQKQKSTKHQTRYYIIK